MAKHTGGCHCGNISVLYTTGVAPEETTPRACQCDFCRKHNTSAVSDPDGDLAISVRDASLLNRYQFGLKAADFLICRACGVYVAAFMPDPDDKKGVCHADVGHARRPRAISAGAAYRLRG